MLIGHSRGGSIAMLAAVSNPHVEGFVAIMSSAAPAMVDEEWKEQGFHTSYRDLPPGDKPNPEQIRFDLPYYYYEHNLLEDLSTCHKPKLFILGKHDHPDVNEDVLQAFGTSAEPKKLFELDSGHGYRYYPQAIEEVNTQLGIFIDEFNMK